MITINLQEIDQMSWEPTCTELYEALSFFRSHGIPLLLIDVFLAADMPAGNEKKRIMGLAHVLFLGDITIAQLIEDGFYLVHGRRGRDAKELSGFVFYMTMDGYFWKSE